MSQFFQHFSIFLQSGTMAFRLISFSSDAEVAVAGESSLSQSLWILSVHFPQSVTGLGNRRGAPRLKPNSQPHFAKS